MTALYFNIILDILREITSPLKHLNLNSCNLMRHGDKLSEMAGLPSTHKLEYLQMGSNGIMSIDSLLPLLKWCKETLVKLHLHGNRLKDDSIQKILSLFHPPFCLDELHLQDNFFSDDSNSLLKNMTKSSKTTVLV